jgi:hypothetical protein
MKEKDKEVVEKPLTVKEKLENARAQKEQLVAQVNLVTGYIQGLEEKC